MEINFSYDADFNQMEPIAHCSKDMPALPVIWPASDFSKQPRLILAPAIQTAKKCMLTIIFIF